MSKNLNSAVIAVSLLLILLGVAGFIYYNTKVIDTCGKVLERYTANHLCISTNKGNMVFELYPESAPKSVERIKYLSNNLRFYDGLEFYRVVKGFVVQGGIQDFRIRNQDIDIKDVAMSEKIRISTEESIPVETNFKSLELDELTQEQLVQSGYQSDESLKARKFEYGSLSFANQGEQNPNSNSTEFFIVTSDDPNSENVKYLNGRFSNMGKLVEGRDVLDLLNNLAINDEYLFSSDKSKPFETITIFEIRVK